MLKKDKHNDITDFSILKFLDISIRPKKGSSPIPIIQSFPTVGWVKVKTDGATKGCPDPSTCVAFRGSIGEYIGSFSSYLRVQKSLYVEVMGAILAVVLSWNSGYRKIWFKCDSTLL